jgi:glycosyltransferase involved in cell wall biosynthesis
MHQNETLRSREQRRELRLLVTVTLNENQLRAHIQPIVALDQVASVTLVADAHAPSIPKLRSVVPPPSVVRIAGRAGAKLLVCLLLALRERPAWILGYNLVPHAVNALIVARVTRRSSLFHMIGGPVELLGGGWRSDNAVLGRLPRPLPALESLLFWIVRRFTAVAVMGNGAKRLLVSRGVRRDRVISIPAAIDETRFRPCPNRPKDLDIVMVAQLIPRKRPHDFVEAIARLRAHRPGLRAAVVGTGPLENEVREHVARLGVADGVELLGFRSDIEDIYSRSRIFVLTSRYEGLSIALTEAMASGLPVIATDVGEVRDVVRPGENGYLFRVGDVGELVQLADTLLDDPARLARMGEAAAAAARAVAGRDRIEDIYRQLLR